MRFRRRRRRSRFDSLLNEFEVEYAQRVHYQQQATEYRERVGMEVRRRQSAEQEVRLLRRRLTEELSLAQAWSDLKDKRFEVEDSLLGPCLLIEDRRVKEFEAKLRGLLDLAG